MAREALGWTQKDLAQRAGLGFTTVKRFELGAAVHGAFPVMLRQVLADAGVIFVEAGEVVGGRRVRFGVLLVEEGGEPSVQPRSPASGSEGDASRGD